MYRDMSAADLAEWEALYVVDPWGEQRADLRAGTIAAAAVAPYSKKGNPPKPADFMHYLPKRKPTRQDDKLMKAQVQAICAGMGIKENITRG